MIKVIEELSLNSWPSLQTMLFDGWMLRFANGYTKRSNSISPIFSSSLNTDEKIQFCEKIYKRKGLDVIFKITSSVYPENLDRILESKKYLYDAPTSVQILQLDNIDLSSTQPAVSSEILSNEWLSDFCRLVDAEGKHKQTLKKILNNIVPGKCFASIREQEQGHMICSGLGVLQEKYFGLYNIVTAENSRNQGLGRQMTLNVLA